MDGTVSRSSLLTLPQQVRRQRQIDCKDASGARQIAHADGSPVRFDAALGDGKSQAEPGSIGPALLERAKQFLGHSLREAAAFVLDFDQDAISRLRRPSRRHGYAVG